MCIRDRYYTGELNVRKSLVLILLVVPITKDTGDKINILLLGVDAVSYTHLDVYKRQGIQIYINKKIPSGAGMACLLYTSLFIAMTMCIILFQDYKPFKVITVNSGVAIKRMGI